MPGAGVAGQLGKHVLAVQTSKLASPAHLPRRQGYRRSSWRKKLADLGIGVGGGPVRGRGAKEQGVSLGSELSPTKRVSSLSSLLKGDLWGGAKGWESRFKLRLG